ncbi:hypothetical protein FRC06_002001 [Ceratobasidium sp. 370]|nr:hypothetical protein FRC06_002001 [Ceratobasidium sp. 370]
MLRNGDFSACIFVDGVEVEYFNARVKYDDSEAGREVMHAYIIGEPGKVRPSPPRLSPPGPNPIAYKELYDHRGTNHSSGHIFVDGKDVASAIMRRGRGKPVSRSGAKVSANKLRPFKFAHLTTTSDDKIADKKKDKDKLKEMSTIRLAITYVELGGLVPFKSLEVEDWGPVHEEAKALGLTTRYDPKIDIPPSRAVASRPLNPEQDGPDVQFVFTYATKAHLMAADIIPNPNAPKLTKNTALRTIELDDEGNEVVAPSTPAPKRPRNNKRASSNSDDSGEQTTAALKRPRHLGSSPPSSVGDMQEQGGLSREDDEDLAIIQRHMDEYNLRNSHSDGSRDGDENDVEANMRVNDEESQDL